MTENEARQMEVEIKWNGRANVCVHCGKVPETYYITTGHDHTDDSIRYCFCRSVAPSIEQLQARVALIFQKRNGYMEAADRACDERDEFKAKIAKLEAENAKLHEQVDLQVPKMAFTQLKEQLAKAEQRVAEWQPIETAPKIGAHLAIDIPNDCARRPYVIVWLDADHPNANGAGWYEHWSFDPVEPTHWMPLPKAPNGASS